jgi:hypothetical protein
MQFAAIQKEDPERVFTIVYNVAGATITLGYPCVWDISASVDGLRVSKPATATLSLFVGIAVENISDSNYGKVQNYGYRESALVTNDTSQAIAAGDILIGVNAQWHLARSAASDGKTGFVYAAEAFATATTPAAANKKVLIRAL